MQAYLKLTRQNMKEKSGLDPPPIPSSIGLINQDAYFKTAQEVKLKSEMKLKSTQLKEI